jgi:molybdate transport system ATP-binding protein
MSGLSLAIRHRVDDFSLNVALDAPSGVTGIIGPSGAGKSMMLQIIAGLQRPDYGQITFDGETLSDTEQRTHISPERRRIGYVFQDALLFPHLNVAQNLDYGSKRRESTGQISRDDVISLLGISPLLDRRPHHLSGGEAQRVSIGRALLSNPRLLLMDEPLSRLDPRRRADILPFIEALHRQLDLPILYVSHNINEITRLADRVCVLHAGQIMASGGVAEVLNQQDMQRLILSGENDDDPASIVEAQIEAHDASLHVTTLALGSARLSLPLHDLALGSTVRLRIHARDVAVALERPEGLSIQNIIESQIVEISSVASGQLDLALAIDGTHRLNARVTRRAGEQLSLTPGMKVWALIKTVALASGT